MFRATELLPTSLRRALMPYEHRPSKWLSLNRDVILRRAEGAPRDRTSLSITTAVEETVRTACMRCTPIRRISPSSSSEVPDVGFAAAQDDNGLEMTALDAVISSAVSYLNSPHAETEADH